MTFSRKIFCLVGFLSALFLAGPVFEVYAETLITGIEIDVDTTWSKVDSPYLVDGFIKVDSGATLFLEPGVVVRFNNRAGLDVYGKLVAKGTSIEKVYFSSFRDIALEGEDFSKNELARKINSNWKLNFYSGSEFSFEHSILSFSSNRQSVYGSSGIFNNVVLSNTGGLIVEESFVEFLDSSFNNVDNTYVYNKGYLRVSSSTINNSENSVVFSAFDSGRVEINNSIVSNLIDSSLLGVFDNSYGLISSSTIALDYLSFVYPVFVYNGSELDISSSTITGILGQVGVVIFDDADSLKASEVKITRSILSGGFSDGIIVFGGANLSISDSTIEGFISSGINGFDGGSISVVRSEISNNGTGIRTNGADVFVSESIVKDNLDYGINNLQTSIVVDAVNNWWGDESGPYHQTLNPAGLGDTVSSGVSFDPWKLKEKEEKIKPVIIIPGILGSARKNGVWVIDPIFHIYDNLMGTLLVNGYSATSTLFTFPYDWRNSNVESGRLLKKKIEEVKKICECDKVNIVAHSMGGLVARSYAQSEEYTNDIDQLIFLGTPHRGAPSGYLMWEAGEFSSGPENTYLRLYFSKEAKHRRWHSS